MSWLMLSRVLTVLKREANARFFSKVVWFLTVMMKHGYIGEIELTDDHRVGKIVVNLTGKLNKYEIIIPGFDM